MEINRCFNEVFHLKRPIEEWRWKFGRSGVEPPILLGFLEGRLVTQYAGLPVDFHWKGRVFPAVQIVDVFSTSAARRFARRGYWVQTVEAFFEEFGFSGKYPLLYGFPGRRALRLGVLQLGYDALEAQSILEFRRSRERGAFPSPQRFLYRALKLDGGEEGALDGLWERVRSSYPYACVRNARRLQRRYFLRPNGPYHVFGVRPRFSTELVGWAVFKAEDGVCCWVDLLWDHGHPGALDLLSHLAFRLARQLGAVEERIWVHGDAPTVEHLGEKGFEAGKIELPLAFVARSFRPDVMVAELENRVYLTMGDTDLF